MENEELANLLANKLNQHGYGFQAAVFNQAMQATSSHSQWIFYSSELPVTINGYETKIDILLRHQKTGHYLLCECKRVNPAVSNWCFLKTIPYKRNQGASCSPLDSVKYDLTATHLPMYLEMEPIFDLGVTIKSNSKGISNGNGSRDELNDAITQVLKGASGFVQFLKQYPKQGKIDKFPSAVIPVIFTTANLFTTEVNLQKSDIQNGKITKSNVTPAKSVILRYPMSDSLTISPDEAHSEDIGEFFDEKYMRTVMIVNSTNISEFLNKDFDIAA